MSRTEQNSLCDRGRYGAFSLIELLVVLGVIAVLMATLLPVLGKARKQGRSVVCLHNVRRLALSGVMYAQANEAFPPHRMKRKSFFDTDNFVNKYGRDRPRWPWFFDEGIGPVIDPAPWVKQPGDVFTDAETMLMTNDNFICPSFRHAEYNVYDIRNGSYGYNYQYLGNARDRPDLGKFQHFPVRETTVKRAAETIVVGDGRGSGHPHGEHSYKLDPPKLALSTGAAYFGNWKLPTLQEQHCPAEARHHGRANISFLDGHASSFTLDAMGYIQDANGLVLANHSDGDNRMFTGTGRDDSSSER